MDYRNNTAAGHALILAAAAAAIGLQLAEPGYYMLMNFDAAVGQKFAGEFLEALRQGVLYPRWVSDYFNGLGSPTFVFYSPLLYFLVSLLCLAGLGMPAAFSLVFLAGLYAGGACMFHLVGKRFGYAAGLVSGLSFILLPTRIADFYLLNTMSGRLAQAWLPAVLLSVDRYMEGGFSRRGIAFVAVSYAGLVMSHIATAFIFTPFVVAYGLVAADGAAPIGRRAIKLAGALTAGLCLAAVYFLPALAERGHVQTEYFLSAHEFSKFFIFNVFTAHEPVNIEGLIAITRNNVMIELVVALAFFYLAVRMAPASGKRFVYFLLASLLACLFMMSSPSAPLWDIVPGVSTTGYPGRFGALFATFLSALVGAGASGLYCGQKASRLAAISLAAFLCLIAITDVFMITRSHRYSRQDMAAISNRIDLPEYLPKTAELEVVNDTSPDMPLLSAGAAFVSEIIRWGNADRLFTVDSEKPVILTVKTFHFPGWRAWVDGSEVPVGVQESTGAMLVDVPAGRHEVRLCFTDTWPRKAGKAISIVTLALLVVPYGLIRRRTARA